MLCRGFFKGEVCEGVSMGEALVRSVISMHWRMFRARILLCASVLAVRLIVAVQCVVRLERTACHM